MYIFYEVQNSIKVLKYWRELILSIIIYFKINDMLLVMASSFLYVFELRTFFIIWILPQEFRENPIWIMLCNIQRIIPSNYVHVSVIEIVMRNCSDQSKIDL